jgi:hypothetical protein
MKNKLFLFTVVLFISTLCLTFGCSESKEGNIPFNINVIPEQLKGNSIAGQHCVFLVTIANEEGVSQLPVNISATAPNSDVVIYQDAIVEGQVAEVWVTPAQASTGTTIEVTVTGKRGAFTDEEVITFDVVDFEEDRAPYAIELRDKFVSWLESNHPELGITKNTECNGTIVSPEWLAVSHYLFFSEEWEMHIEWHIMIPPYDWAKIDLRHRFDELEPSYAFEISSLDANSDPVTTEVPETVWR